MLVKLLPGRTEEQKKELTDKIVQAVKEYSKRWRVKHLCFI
ncbi:hypothetical protein ACFQDF_29135 [Ectobacillus funiculus]